MAAATRPAAGAPIESAWGGQAHDAAVAILGVVCSAAAYTSGTGGPADLNAVVEGKASMADLAGNQVIVPQAGVYEVWAVLSASGIAVGGTYRFDLQVGVAAANYQNVAGGSFPGTAGNVVRGYGATVKSLNAGDGVRIQIGAPSSGSGTQSVTVLAFGVRLIGQAWAA